MNSGDSRPFRTQKPIFAGNPAKGISGHIICWEADDSPGGWYERLINLMWEVARLSSEMAFTTGSETWDVLYNLVTPVGKANSIILWLENIATLVAAFLSWIRNHDDKVKECTYAFNKHWVYEARDNRKNLEWYFDGGNDGNHTLVIQFGYI